jgi:hypothetical protein
MLFVLVNTKPDIFHCELLKNNSDKYEMIVRNMIVQKSTNKFLIVSKDFYKDKWKEINKDLA